MSETAITTAQRRIADLWQRNQTQIDERLALLERAAADAATGALTPALREEAAATAHKLAGSLGMFGFHEGTRLARELEHLLLADGPDPALLAALATQLRNSLNPAR